MYTECLKMQRTFVAEMINIDRTDNTNFEFLVNDQIQDQHLQLHRLTKFNLELWEIHMHSNGFFSETLLPNKINVFAND